MPDKDSYRKAFRPTADPLGEFAEGGEFQNLNVEAGSFEGDGAADREAQKALGAIHAGIRKTEKISSIKGHETKVGLPAQAGPNPLDK